MSQMLKWLQVVPRDRPIRHLAVDFAPLIREPHDPNRRLKCCLLVRWLLGFDYGNAFGSGARDQVVGVRIGRGSENGSTETRIREGKLREVPASLRSACPVRVGNLEIGLVSLYIAIHVQRL